MDLIHKVKIKQTYDALYTHTKIWFDGILVSDLRDEAYAETDGDGQIALLEKLQDLKLINLEIEWEK